MPPEMILLAALDGLAYGSLIFLVAVGLSLIFGVLGVLNIAHGSFYAIGAYVAASAVLAAAGMGLPTWLAFPLFLISAIRVGVVVGGTVEALLLRRVYGSEEVLQLLVTFAVYDKMALYPGKLVTTPLGEKSLDWFAKVKPELGSDKSIETFDYTK